MTRIVMMMMIIIIIMVSANPRNNKKAKGSATARPPLSCVGRARAQAASRLHLDRIATPDPVPSPLLYFGLAAYQTD